VADRDRLADRLESDRARPQCRSKLGSPTVAVPPATRSEILDAAGNEVPAGRGGQPRGAAAAAPGHHGSRLWGDDERFISSYLSAFDGYYATGDGGYIDEDGYVFVMGRTDDVINVAGHRLSTGSIEAAIGIHIRPWPRSP
jgi:propionyl-CoA synthetase